jgi:hypothetical protein
MTYARAGRRMRSVALAAALACLARAPRSAAAEEVLRDEWTAVYVEGAKAGHAHTVVRRLADPPRVETTTDEAMKFKRLNMTIETSSSKTTLEEANGALLSIVSRSRQSTVETLTEIAFAGGKALVKTTTMGQTREAVVDVPPDLVGPWRAERIPQEAGYPAGKAFDAKVFLAEMGGPVTATTTVVGPEEVDVPGAGKASLVRLEGTITGIPIRATSWVDASGSTVLTRMALSGLSIEGRRTTQEKALADESAKGPTPDLFTKTLIVSKVLVPHARTLESAVLRIRPRTKDAKLPDLADGRQTLERREPDGSLVLRIRRTVPPPGAATRPLAAPPPEVAPFLAPSSTIQSDDPSIVQAAGEAVKGEKDAWKAAQAIETWVDLHLTKKSMGVAFASALEVCRNREGDCTEHAVLVAALLRAAGIPSRVVMGLEYLAGIFGGHAWSEAWIAGSWYALDATQSYGFVDPLHVSIGASAMAEGSFGQEYTSLIGIVGSVDVEVLEATWNGRTLRVSDPAAIRVEGTRYANRLFDLSFEAPGGFAVEAVVPKGLEDRLAVARGKTAAGGDVTVTVRVGDTPARGFPRRTDATEIAVDGRPAHLRERSSGALAAEVVVGDTGFRFEVVPGGAPERAVLEAILSTVDLDPAKE